MYDIYQQMRNDIFGCSFKYDKDLPILKPQKSDRTLFESILPGIASHAGSGVSRKVGYIFGIYIHDGAAVRLYNGKQRMEKFVTSPNIRGLPFDALTQLMS